MIACNKLNKRYTGISKLDSEKSFKYFLHTERIPENTSNSHTNSLSTSHSTAKEKHKQNVRKYLTKLCCTRPRIDLLNSTWSRTLKIFLGVGRTKIQLTTKHHAAVETSNTSPRVSESKF